MNTYNLQTTTIWSFPDRGNWGTHKGDYRGNWSPHIPRNLILKYTNEGDTVLDCFAGSGTTLIESKLLNRNSIGIEINKDALEIIKSRLSFTCESNAWSKLYLGDAQDLRMLKDHTVDFICTHPPYANIIKYSANIHNDMSHLEYSEFLKHMEKVSKELFRVLKPYRYCAFMMGDIRKKGNVIPLGFMNMSVFINNGFTLKEIIIKKQHNCHSTDYWKKKSSTMGFYLLAHEYIFVLYKTT